MLQVPADGRNGRAERRATARYPARGALAQIGWCEGAGHRIAVTVLGDISLSGTSGCSSLPIPIDETVWIRLCRPASTDWIEARTMAVKQTFANMLRRRQEYQVRLRFSEACPYAFIQHAVRTARRHEAGTDHGS